MRNLPTWSLAILAPLMLFIAGLQMFVGHKKAELRKTHTKTELFNADSTYSATLMDYPIGLDCATFRGPNGFERTRYVKNINPESFNAAANGYLNAETPEENVPTKYELTH